MWELICLPDLKGEEESGGELDCGRSKKAGITFKKGDESQEDDDDYGGRKVDYRQGEKKVGKR